MTQPPVGPPEAPTRLALVARSDRDRDALHSAAERRGLDVVDLSPDPESVLSVCSSGPAAAWRAPGGLLAAAAARGAAIQLSGATPQWFALLPEQLTGRRWELVPAAEAVASAESGPLFVKLAGAKHRAFPARRYTAARELRRSLTSVAAPPDLQLLVTDTWLAIDSEYRAFCIGPDVATVSPYLVQDDPWSPLLPTHHASFHHEAAAWLGKALAALAPADVPPTAVLDVARLDDGRFIVLEANDAWSSGMYGCDPDRVVDALLAAATPGPEQRWTWRPDPAVLRLRSPS